MNLGCEVYQHLKDFVKEKYGQDTYNVGDEGSSRPTSDPKKRLNAVNQAIEKAGYAGGTI